MEQTPNTPKLQNWLDRNWKWLVPSGCLFMILIFSGIIASIFFGVTYSMENSDAFKGAINKVRNDKELTEKLGRPIEVDGMIQGSINTSDYSGNANLQVPLKGNKGSGILFIVAKKRVSWKYEELYVHLNATSEEINLLTNTQEK